MGGQPMSPMRRVLAVLGTFAAGCAASVALWNGWSDRCGDGCPSPRVVHMLVFLALLPTFGAMGAVLVVATPWPVRVKQAIAAALLLAAAIVGVLVARLPEG